jgi:RimJ/RimL family protein N-acetyltransferase
MENIAARVDRRFAERRTAAVRPASPVSTEWVDGLPVLTGAAATLRELELADAPALLAMLGTAEVTQFISPAPSTIDGFERFIVWANCERARGTHVCFAVVPHGMDSPVGIFQVRQLEPGFATAEWGFAIASEFWGTGLFLDAARLVADFAFEVIQVHRLEARAAVLNGRGIGALKKIGAIPEGILRKSLFRNGEYLDQALWTILDEDWHAMRIAPGLSVH